MSARDSDWMKMSACKVCQGSERNHNQSSLKECTYWFDCPDCIPCVGCKPTNEEIKDETKATTRPTDDASIPALPRTGRRKKTITKGTPSLNPDDDTPTLIGEPKRELQSVAGTLADSKRQRRAKSSELLANRVINRSQITPISNRPTQSPLDQKLKIVADKESIKVHDSVNETADLAELTSKKAQALDNQEAQEDSFNSPPPRMSQIRILKKALSKAEDDENKRMSKMSSKHNVSMEFLAGEGVTKRQTKVFENSYKYDEFENTGIGKRETVEIIPGNSEVPAQVPDAEAVVLDVIKSQDESLDVATLPKKGKNRLSKSFDNLFKTRKHTISNAGSKNAPLETSDSLTPSLLESIIPPSVNESVTRKASLRSPSLKSPSILQKPTLEHEMARKNSLTQKRFRNTKDWYFHFSNDAYKVELKEEPIYASRIKLRDICGSQSQAEDTLSQILWAAKSYEEAKRDQLWSSKSETVKHDTNGSDDIKYRILNIFNDDKIPGVEYEKTDMAGERIVFGSPLDLLDSLIFPLSQSMHYAQVFLATYRFFIAPQRLLDTLMEWYNVDLYDDCLPSEELFLKRHRKNIKNRASKILLYWIKNYWQDFANCQPIANELIAFVNELSASSFGDNQKLSQAIREQRLTWYTSQYIPAFSIKKGSGQIDERAWALTVEASDFAKQLTLCDHFFFRQIKPESYLNLMASGCEKVGGGRNSGFKAILEYFSWFRLLSMYASSVILMEDGTKKQSKALKHLIKLAKELQTLQSYNALFAILSGLKRRAIINLQQVWDQIPFKFVDAFQTLDSLMDPSNGFSTYHAEVSEANPPLSPFFAAYLQRMIETQERIPSFINGGSTIFNPLDAHENDSNLDKPVDFTEFNALYDQITDIETLRNKHYDLQLSDKDKSSDNLNNTPLNPNSQEACALLYNHLKDWTALHMIDDKELDNSVSTTLKSTDDLAKKSKDRTSKLNLTKPELVSSTDAIASTEPLPLPPPQTLVTSGSSKKMKRISSMLGFKSSEIAPMPSTSSLIKAGSTNSLMTNEKGQEDAAQPVLAPKKQNRLSSMLGLNSH